MTRGGVSSAPIIDILCSKFGRFLGEIDGTEFYECPSFEQLDHLTEKDFIALQCGYRSKTIPIVVNNILTMTEKAAEILNWENLSEEELSKINSDNANKNHLPLPKNLSNKQISKPKIKLLELDDELGVTEDFVVQPSDLPCEAVDTLINDFNFTQENFNSTYNSHQNIFISNDKLPVTDNIPNNNNLPIVNKKNPRRSNLRENLDENNEITENTRVNRENNHQTRPNHTNNRVDNDEDQLSDSNDESNTSNDTNSKQTPDNSTNNQLKQKRKKRSLIRKKTGGKKEQTRILPQAFESRLENKENLIEKFFNENKLNGK